MSKATLNHKINGPMVIGFGVIMCTVAVLAFIFNLSILYLLTKKKKLRSTTGSNFLIFNSCIDILFDVSIVTYSLILISSHFELVKTELCPAFTGLMLCCLLLNLLGVTFLGISRYLAVIRKKTLSTTTWSCILIIPCTWVIVTTILMFGTDHWAYTSSGVMCLPKPDISNPYALYFYISLSIWAFFELITLAFCYFSIIFNNEKNIAKMKEYDSKMNSSGNSDKTYDGEEKGSTNDIITTSESLELTPHTEHHENPQIKNLRLISLKLMCILLAYYLSYVPFVIFEISELITGRYKSEVWDLVFDLSKTLCTFTCPLISICLHKPLKLEFLSFARRLGLKSV